jgi:hypothetical protein
MQQWLMVLGDGEHHDGQNRTWDFFGRHDRIFGLRLYSHVAFDKASEKKPLKGNRGMPSVLPSSLLMPSWPKRRLGDAMPRQETITGVKLSPNGWKHATRCWLHTPRRRPACTDFDESLHNTLMRIDSAGQAPH